MNRCRDAVVPKKARYSSQRPSCVFTEKVALSKQSLVVKFFALSPKRPLVLRRIKVIGSLVNL
ncbi:hypothetical protein HNR39_003013 [Glaciimonas immobilis]|uniref:Uncharacterized protein n=1 Tax=Glaciimonas immobilis TaxID=728004 RepID=A0A840RWW7_9BURK|nr:hypothetical protein [Glaciimonas immobilis]